MLGYDGDEMPVYVDEQITKESFMLFKNAKKLKKVGYAYVWISNGDIMVRRNPKSPFIKITSQEQIDSLETAELLRKKDGNTNNKKNDGTTTRIGNDNKYGESSRAGTGSNNGSEESQKEKTRKKNGNNKNKNKHSKTKASASAAASNKVEIIQRISSESESDYENAKSDVSVLRVRERK